MRDSPLALCHAQRYNYLQQHNAGLTRQALEDGMADSIKDGGPAFPETAFGTPDGMVALNRQTGMSLRDWFAGQALPGVISLLSSKDTCDMSSSEIMEVVSSSAYRQADAMLAAREARNA